MTQPHDESDEPDALLVNELMAKLAAFMARYGSPPLVTGKVTRAMTEIASLYQNARLRAHAAERREREAQAEREALRAVAHETRGLLEALIDHEVALGTDDADLIAQRAAVSATAQTAVAEALARLPHELEPELAPATEAALLAALDLFSEPSDKGEAPGR